MTSGRGVGWIADGLGGHAKLCEECGEQFGDTSAPDTASGTRPEVTRCPACRRHRLAMRNERMLAAYASGPLGPRPPRPEAPENGAPLHAAVCAACGRSTRVPFRPRADRPVYCRPCHEARHGR